MEKYKMPRSQRAKQFAPFDALKGLREALRLKEYEHDRTLKGDLSEEKIIKMSNILQNIEKQTVYIVTYFFDGYTNKISGNLKLDIENNAVLIGGLKIDLNNLLDIKILK